MNILFCERCGTWTNHHTEGHKILTGENDQEMKRLRQDLDDARSGWEAAVEYGCELEAEIKKLKNELHIMTESLSVAIKSKEDAEQTERITEWIYRTAIENSLPSGMRELVQEEIMKNVCKSDRGACWEPGDERVTGDQYRAESFKKWGMWLRR